MSMMFTRLKQSKYLVHGGLYLERTYHRGILFAVKNNYSCYIIKSVILKNCCLANLQSQKLLHVSFQNYDKDIAKSEKVEDWSDIASRWYKKYQDFVGLTDILQAQENVTRLTSSLLVCQSLRRRLQTDVDTDHQKLLAVHQRITKAELYSEEHYALFEQARQLNTNLKSLQDQFTKSEHDERSVFSQLSASINHCHEKERAQAEQSKYWSVLISVVSAAIASLITSVNNWVRIREIKDHATSLHTDALSKYEAFEISMSKLLGDKFMKENSQQVDSSVREIVKTELDNFLNSFNTSHSSSSQISTLDSEARHPELTYTKIALAMSAGAAVGVLATAFFFGFPGFGS